MNLYVEDKNHNSKSCEMYVIFLICFMFHALIRCIKVLKEPKLAVGFMNVIKLLCNKVTFISQVHLLVPLNILYMYVALFNSFF
jgi:hypothetical protein